MYGLETIRKINAVLERENQDLKSRLIDRGEEKPTEVVGDNWRELRLRKAALEMCDIEDDSETLQALLRGLESIKGFPNQKDHDAITGLCQALIDTKR